MFVVCALTVSLAPWLLTARQRPLRHVRAWGIGAQLLSDRDVLFQKTDADCGHTALMMVLERFRKTIPPDLARAAMSDRIGLSLDELVVRSIAADLPARIHAVHTRCLAPALSRVTLPAVALMGSHYVVIETPVDASGRLTIIDPGLGRMHMPIDPLHRGWRGYLITFGAVTSSVDTACSEPV